MQVVELELKSLKEPVGERFLSCVSSFDKTDQNTCINNLPISAHQIYVNRIENSIPKGSVMINCGNNPQIKGL